METNSSTYWNNLYRAMPFHRFTWYEPIPIPSLKLISMLNLPLSASIIDVGGGAGVLTRQLLALGYNNVTILDFSSEAIKKGKDLLGEFAAGIKWLNVDVLTMEPTIQYDLWHDRACLHFLINKYDQLKYVESARKSIKVGGALVVGTYSMQGLSQSAGLTVQKYNQSTMQYLFANDFVMDICFERSHITPSNKLEPFVFCKFKKI